MKEATHIRNKHLITELATDITENLGSINKAKKKSRYLQWGSRSKCVMHVVK